LDYKNTHSNSTYGTDFKSARTGLELEFKEYVILQSILHIM